MGANARHCYRPWPLPPRWFFSLLVLLGAAFALAPAYAQTSPAARRYSPYERESIRRALEQVHGELEVDAHGKLVEGIDVVTLDVIEDRDPAPLFLNWLHVTTRPYVIEREVLLKVGGPFDQRLSDETERNLRSLFLFSVVVAVPTKGSGPGRVRYLVVTKDIWSLRASWDGRFNNGVIDFLSFQPTERNLFGTGRQVYGRLIFTPTTYTVGAGFLEPRLEGTRLRIAANVNAIVGCQSGDIEGTSGVFSYSLPLYSASTKWAYSTSVSWSDRINRLRGATLNQSICSAGVAREATVRVFSGRRVIIPNEYSADGQSFTQDFTRSFGRVYKTNLSFGLEARRYAYRADSLATIRPVPSDASDAAPASDAPLTFDEWRASAFEYVRYIPRNYTRLSPFFQVASYTTNFHRDINSETLGLQEDIDFRLGPLAILRLYPALKDLGSTRNLLGIQATLSYATSVRTGFFKVIGTHFVEISSPAETDAELSLSLRYTTPRLGFGRFVYDLRFIDRYRNFFNDGSVLDGTNRLRGYKTSVEDFGPNLLASNVEFRTLPVQILSTQWAAVVFQDVGDTFFGFDEIKLRQGMGVGLRFLAPQLDRDVFRFDVGFPVPFDTPRGKLTFVAAFGQAFDVP